MNGALLSTTQILNNISQFLNYSNVMRLNEGYSREDQSLIDEQNDDQTPSTSRSGSSSNTSNSTAQHQLFTSLSNYLQKKETENAKRLLKGSSYGSDKQQSLSLINRSLNSRRRLNKRERNIHPVTSYFLITDEKSKCAVCILCLNVMKAGKTANLMRHMSRYHKLVAIELEKQWDLIKINNSNNNNNNNNNNKSMLVNDISNRCHSDTALYTSSSNDEHTVASPFTNESSNNESTTTNTTLLPNDSALMDNDIDDNHADNYKDLLKTERDQDGNVRNEYAITMQLINNATSSSVDRSVESDNTDAIDNGNDKVLSNSNMTKTCTCKNSVDDDASASSLLVALLKRQEELIKKTERLFEENAKREERVEQKEDELQKFASELSNKYDQQHKLLSDLTSKLQFIIDNMHNKQPP